MGPLFVVSVAIFWCLEVETGVLVESVGREFLVWVEITAEVNSAGLFMLNGSKYKSPKRASRRNNKPINKIHLYFLVFSIIFSKGDNFSSTLILLGLM